MTPQFERIATFIETPNVPESARRMAALLLIDTLGVAAAAHAMTPARIARETSFNFLNASQQAHVVRMLFDGRNVSVPGAAFAAATQIDNLDAHDGYNPTKGHIGCAVVPALCTFGQLVPTLSSRAALDVLAMSYEVGARAAIALHRTVTDYHTSGAWNALAVAAIGCRLLDSGRTELREALGVAEYHGPRSQMMREIANPTMLHDGSGMGALTGAMAALMAHQGFQGAPAITVEDDDVADVWATLGSEWTIEQNYIKPYPICRWAHAPLDAVQELVVAHDLAPDDISKLAIRTFKESAALFPGVPDTTSQAQYSLGFAVAAMVVHRRVGPHQISGAGLKDPAVIDVLGRISVFEEERHSRRFPAQRCADITITLNNGTVLESGDHDARGGPEVPMSISEVAEKFSLFAGPMLGRERTERLWQMHEDMLVDGHMFQSLLDLVLEPPAH